MSEWFACARFSLDADLAQVNRVLSEREIVHRFTEEKGVQLLWLLHRTDLAVVEELLTRWQKGEGVELQNPDLSNTVGDYSKQSFDQALLNFLAAPASALIVVLGVLGTLLVSVDVNHQYYWVSKFSFFPMEISGPYQYFSSAKAALLDGQIWRLITPSFLHFGALHILFNGLWIWVFGQQVESKLGSRALLLVFAFTAVLSNIIQALWSGPSLFGGLSGVVYGLLGYIWVWQMRMPRANIGLPPGIIGFMLVWLLLGLFGVIELVAGASIANGAHLGGLLAGMLLAFLQTHWLGPRLNAELKNHDR